MHANEIIAICGVVTVGFICQWLAWRARLPAILFLLLAGMLLGPVFQLVDPDALFGDLIVPFVSIGVAIILFEGALTLKFSDIRGHGRVVAKLVTVGVLITWAGSGLAAFFLLGWDPYMAMLFGAIVTVSGPTVVMPILRSVRPQKSVASVLRWEAILIDPLGAVLALLVFEFIVAAQVSAGLLHALETVLYIAVAGSTLGIAGGYLLGQAIRRRLIPDFLRDYAALASVLTIFALAEGLRGESGLLAVTVMGIWLANLRNVDLDDILEFKESLTLLLVASLFIVLAARIDLNELYAVGMGALTLVLVLQFIVSPLRAFICAIGSSLKWREKLFLSWIFPRGIVAAAISALFALRLEAAGQLDTAGLVPLVFSVIIGTVIIQSLTAKPIARWLDVAEPDPNGVLIIGSNPVAIAIAKELSSRDVPVLVADTHWASVQEARMQGLPTFFGSAVSQYAERNLDLSGLGVLLAISRRPGLNELACLRYASEFGRDHVFTIGSQPKGAHSKHKVSGESRGRMILGEDVTLSTLTARIAGGHVLKSTELTEEFDFAAYKARYAHGLVLFGLDKNMRTHFPVEDEKFEPEEGWRVVALLPPAEK